MYVGGQRRFPRAIATQKLRRQEADRRRDVNDYRVLSRCRNGIPQQTEHQIGA
jgi:hypothetical protein